MAFLTVLAAADVRHRPSADPLGHSRVAITRETPRMLVDLGNWMAIQGVS
jgi:hypothetical protein